MIDLQLLDGRLLDAAREGDWTLVVPVASVLLVVFISGLMAWLKGRKLAAIFVWVLLVAAGVTALMPIDPIQDRYGTDPETLTWIVLGVVGLALLVGLVAAIRLARPPSWWAQRRYDNDRYAKAIERHRWTRVKPR